MALVGPLSIWQAEPSPQGLMRMTVGDLIDHQAQAHPASEALVFAADPIQRWSYHDLQRDVDHLAMGLIALGIAKGDHVAVLSPNSPDWVMLEFALAKIGAVMVTVNTGYRQIELGYILRQGQIRALFCVSEFRGNDFLAAIRALIVEGLPDLRHVVCLDGPADGFLSMQGVLAQTAPANELARRQASVWPDDIAQIQYTSGTTGAPKGVMLTHAGIVGNAKLMGDRALWTASDRLLGMMPLFHTAGCVCNVLGMITRGGTLVLMAGFDAAQALALLQSERITVTNGVPTMYLRLLAEPGVREGNYRKDSLLHTAFAGGTNIPPTMMRDLQEAFGAAPMLIMGMTEASPIITQTLPTGSFADNVSSAGIPLPYTEIKVIDPDSGIAVPLGQPGELCIRGYGVTQGYFAMPERTAEAIDAEGWLHSGDLATLSQTGSLRIVGRTKDMIIRGGENIYPAEIEDLLMHHPAVEQVQVVGVPDPEFGEEAFAFIIARPDAELGEPELRAYARAHFSRHKVPRYMRFVESFPQTASGKVQKFSLREIARRSVSP